MRGKFSSIVHELTPPILIRIAEALRAPNANRSVGQEPAGEKDAAWYDASFDACDHWRDHYSQSEYYFLWTVIADRIASKKTGSILEVGCGPGQLACLLKDKGVHRYHGFDFSPNRIEQARRACTGFTFGVEDAFKTDWFTRLDYDAVVCTEFLEHVEGDLALLGRIRPGAKFYGTVPNFPFISHVRHFANEDEVYARYAGRLTDLRVDTFQADANGKTFYLIEGTIA
jgi:2-polyprenyl-3-methyl-5-hydroxy-6-metoxy-1,4-benzoquinol methylase